MHPNFDIRTIDEEHAELICTVCGDTKRQTRVELKQLIESSLFEDNCPSCGAPYYDYTEEESSSDELLPIGNCINDVVKKAKDHDAYTVLSNLSSILMEKEDKEGLEKFSVPERYIYVIDGMIREVNNGGFEQFFYNSSGALSYDLLPALNAVGSSDALKIAKEALSIFGDIPSLDTESRADHLKKITKDHTLSLWGQCDESFYELSEDLEKLAVDYFIRSTSLNRP